MASSSASSSKRKRIGDPSPPPLPPVVESWSEYFNDPSADIILQSVDGRLFATQKMYLASASSVFEDILRMPQPKEADARVPKQGQAAPGVLPVVEMAEKGDELEPFLRWIHRDTFEDIYKSIDAARKLINVSEVLLAILSCAKKFDARAVFPPIRKTIGEHLHNCTSSVLALAVVYDWPDLAEKAIHHWMNEIEMETDEDGGTDSSMYNVRTETLHLGNRPWTIASIWPALLPLLSVGFCLHVSRAEQMMLFAHEYDVDETVKTFMKALKAGFPLKCESRPLFFGTAVCLEKPCLLDLATPGWQFRMRS